MDALRHDECPEWNVLFSNRSSPGKTFSCPWIKLLKPVMFNEPLPDYNVVFRGSDQSYLQVQVWKVGFCYCISIAMLSGALCIINSYHYLQSRSPSTVMPIWATFEEHPKHFQSLAFLESYVSFFTREMYLYSLGKTERLDGSPAVFMPPFLLDSYHKTYCRRRLDYERMYCPLCLVFPLWRLCFPRPSDFTVLGFPCIIAEW